MIYFVGLGCLVSIMKENTFRFENTNSFIIALVFLIGLFLSILAAYKANVHSETMMIKTVDSLADSYVAMIHASLIRTNEELESTGAFMIDDVEEHGDDVIGVQEDFHHFTRHLILDNLSVRLLEWVPYVLHQQRLLYEEKMDKGGIGETRFHFTEKNTAGELIIAHDRAQYFPIYYIEPMQGGYASHGYDLASDPLYYPSIQRAMVSGQPSVTKATRLSNKVSENPTVMYFIPVYNDHDDQGHEHVLLGFAWAVVDVKILIQSSLQSVLNQELGFSVYDQQDSVPKEGSISSISPLGFYVYDRLVLPKNLLYQQGDSPARSSRFVSHKTIYIEDRMWPAVFWPTEAYLNQHNTWLDEGILLVGVLLSFLLSMYLHLLQSRNQSIQKQVEEQTQALMDGNKALLENINQRIFAEQEVRSLNEDLEARVQSRTLALAASNRELEAFCYSVSHDLRAPLRSISGFSQILLEDYLTSLDENAQDYLQRVDHAAKQMGGLIDDLLRLSRINREDMVYHQVDLTTLAYRKIDLLSEMQRGRHISFDIQENMQVNGDQNLLKLLVQNLLENAMKYTAKETQAHIEFGVQNMDGEQVFFVRDNGVGFDMTYADKLFQPFQRLHSVKEFPGSGVGLATVQRVIQRHGGRIWADAQVGEGAVFYFVLK